MRAPRYGELGTASLHPTVRALWYSRDEELPELPSWRWSFHHQTDLSQVEDRELIAVLLERIKLTKQEQMAIALVVYGDETLDVAGRRLGVTRERVRQIEKAALTKLRNNDIHDYEFSNDVMVVLNKKGGLVSLATLKNELNIDGDARSEEHTSELQSH